MAEQAQLFQILTKQHREVESMLAQLAGAEDEETRETLFPVLKQQLLAHSKAEEKTFYPALARAGADDEAEHAEHEHQEMEAALEKVEGLDFGDEGWPQALQELTEAVQEHVEEEESEVFDAARELLEAEALEQLAEEFREQRQTELEALGGSDDGYEELTKEELLEEARERDLSGRSGMNKDELIAHLRAGH